MRMDYSEKTAYLKQRNSKNNSNAGQYTRLALLLFLSTT